MDKHIIVFCEGDHDIAFLTRIIQVQGFKPYKKTVKNFPSPLNDLYLSNLSGKKIEDYEFKFQRPSTKIPFSVFYKEDILVVFHNLDGDGSFSNGKVNDVVNMYLNLNKENIRKIRGYEKLDFRFLYFLDSDDQGVEFRINSLKETIGIDTLENHNLTKKDDYEVGCYVFHDSEHPNKHGKLEDIILKLMNTDNQKTFTDSLRFIDENHLDEKRCKKFICDNIEEVYVGNAKFKKMKSTISIAGQLQFSGSSNAVIIANSDYLTREQLTDDLDCRRIFTLFDTSGLEVI